MQLVGDWRAVLRRAWSVRLIIVAGLLSGLEVIWPLLDGYLDVPRGLFAAASGLTAMGAFVARLVAQQSLTRKDC